MPMPIFIPNLIKSHATEVYAVDFGWAYCDYEWRSLVFGACCVTLLCTCVPAIPAWCRHVSFCWIAGGVEDRSFLSRKHWVMSSILDSGWIALMRTINKMQFVVI